MLFPSLTHKAPNGGQKVNLRAPSLPSEPPQTGRVLLEDIDFRTPRTSWKEGFEYFSSPNATHEWTIGNTAYSSGYAPSRGTAVLEKYLAGGLSGQVAPDVYTEAGYDTCGAWEAVSTNDKLELDDTTTGNFDPTAEDFCFRIAFRVKGSMPNSEYLLTKWSGGIGWRVYTASSGEWYFGLKDDLSNSGGVAGAASGVSGAMYDDGSVHYITGFVDSSTGTIYTKGDLSAETSASIAGVVGSIDTTTEMSVNGYATNTGLAGWQCLYVGIAIGGTAEAMYAEDFFQHQIDPTSNSVVSAVARAGLVSGEIAPGVIGHVRAGRVPLFYDAEADGGAGGLSLHPNPVTTNLLPDSENVLAWAASSPTKTANVSSARDGFFAAGSITATADNQIQRMSASSIAVANATEYTLSALIKSADIGGADVVGALRIWHGGYVATEVFTANGSWQLVSVTWTSTSTAMEPYLRIDTDTEGVIIHESQINTGNKRANYVRTSGGARILPASDYQATIDIKPSSGEIEFDFIPRSTGAIAVPYRSGVSSPDRRDLQQAASGAVFSSVHNDSGAGEGAFSYPGGWALDSDNKHRLLWDSIVGVDGREAITFLNGVRANGDAFPWEGTATADVISDVLRIGSSGVSYALDGSISRIRIYDAPGEL